MNIYQLVKKYNISKALFVIYFTFFVLIFYFVITMTFGAKGLVEYFSLRQELKNQNIVKQQLLIKKDKKAAKVMGMKSNSLDLDLLDEEARKQLGYSGENEIVIFDNKNQKNGK